MANDYENYDAMLERVKELVEDDSGSGREDLTVAETAEALGKPVETIRTWCQRGDTFPHAHVAEDGDYRIPFADVEAMRRGDRLHDLQEPIAEE